jgi:hypothetical protein
MMLPPPPIPVYTMYRMLSLRVSNCPLLPRRPDGATVVKQVIHYESRPEHNGKSLSCVVNSEVSEAIVSSFCSAHCLLKRQC